MTIVVKILVAIGEFFISIGRRIGKVEANAQSQSEHNQRVARADAARDDDAGDGVYDPRNRDNR